MLCYDAAALALAILWSRQGRPSHTAPHFPVFCCFGEHEPLRSTGTLLSPFHPPSVRRRKLRGHVVPNRRTCLAGLAAQVPPGLVSQVQLHLGWRTRWWRAGNDLLTLLCRLWGLGRSPAVPICECDTVLLVFGLSLMAARPSGPEILPKETSIIVTEMELWIKYVPMDGTTPWEL